MKKSDNNLIINSLLVNWYENNKRDLPWRNTRDAYTVWISEVILQQTRVKQGLDYFRRFLHRFPDARTLARAHEDEVLKLWQGLGYYSRARNLHAAAQQIDERFGGKFPNTYADIISLKGVGEYTAAAIASIAFGLPHAVVDGNVFRVIARLFAIDTPINSAAGKKLFAEVAQSLLNTQFPGTHNQAMMELGATVCTPANPRCEQCPLADFCMARAQKTMADFPVKIRKNSVHDRYFHYFHIVHGVHTYIAKRTNDDIWKNLYEFPLIETDAAADLTQLMQNERFKEIFGSLSELRIDAKLSLKHVLSHRRIFAVFYRVEIGANEKFTTAHKYIKITDNEMADYPVSRLTHKYLETI